MKEIFRKLANLIFGIRRYNNKQIKQFSQGVRNMRILEIGSGLQKNNTFFYSVKKFFDDSNEFIQSDINPDFGHLVVDITKMTYQNEFDIVICMNVLEHVYDFQSAIKRLHESLKDGGTLIVFVPMVYPLHDEPHDYWRFTEHGLRAVFSQFHSITLKHSGIRQFPVAYYLEIRK